MESIEGHKISRDGERIQFLVKWRNYDSEDNTWESFEFFAQDAPEMAQNYIIRALLTFKVPRETRNMQKVLHYEEKRERMQAAAIL